MKYIDLIQTTTTARFLFPSHLFSLKPHQNSSLSLSDWRHDVISAFVAVPLLLTLEPGHFGSRLLLEGFLAQAQQARLMFGSNFFLFHQTDHLGRELGEWVLAGKRSRGKLLQHLMKRSDGLCNNCATKKLQTETQRNRNQQKVIENVNHQPTMPYEENVYSQPSARRQMDQNFKSHSSLYKWRSFYYKLSKDGLSVIKSFRIQRVFFSITLRGPHL